MLGSSQSISAPNIVLNTIMAEELGKFADILETANDFDTTLNNLICEALTAHQRIIFNGNGYSLDWEKEAAERGLSNLRSTAACLPTYISKKNVELVTKHRIYTEAEFYARHEIHLEAYCKIINIEALTSVDMALHQILPAALKYSHSLTHGMLDKQSVGICCRAERELVERLSVASDSLYAKCEKLKADLQTIPDGAEAAAAYYHDVIVTGMESLRADADILEQLTDKKYWPYPTYSDLLFY